MAVKEQAKHTPGPWSFLRQDGDQHREICAATGESLMGDVQYYPWAPDRDEDWALIAAAPEMLEALKLMVEFYEDADHDEEAKAFPTENCPICRAKAVIRKAGGRS